jgi:hypothetical protein
MAAFDKQVDREYAEAWRPEAGDKLVGEVVELGQREGAFGTYPIVTVRRDDGTEAALHAFHTVAANELAKAAPQVGERIAIKYVGQKETESGQAYHAYRVATDRAGRAFNWGGFSDVGEVGSDIPTDEPKGDGDDIPF